MPLYPSPSVSVGRQAIGSRACVRVRGKTDDAFFEVTMIVDPDKLLRVAPEYS